MAGTLAGGAKAAQTNKLRYGMDYYHVIGKKGGETSTHTGFGSDKVGKDGLTGRERARILGKKGGLASKRPRKVTPIE